MRILSLLVALLVVCTISAQKNELKRFTIKSGFVTYTLTGTTTGTRTIYWDDYGDKSREELNSVTEIKMFGMKNKEVTNTITIMVADKFWSVNLKDKTGQKGTLAMYDKSKEIAGDMTEEEAKELADQMLDALNGEKMGAETFLGKTCEVIKVMGAKIWIYNGLPLKTQMKMMGIENNETATEIKENITISNAKFTPTAGIKFQEIDNLTNTMFEM